MLRRLPIESSQPLVVFAAARFAAAEARGENLAPPPSTTALGALLAHITGDANPATFQPMNVNFGLMPPLPERFRKADRKKAYTERARAAFGEWLVSTGQQPAAQAA